MVQKDQNAAMRKANRNEAARVCDARRGDREAILGLLEDNWPWLKGMLYNILGNAGDVEDVLQNTSLQVIDNIGSLREPERFKSWLAVIARHAALAFRHKRSRKPMQLDEAGAAQWLEDQTVEIVETVSQREQYGRILDAMKLLPEKYREVFILKHLEDHSYVQIAEVLEITVTTVQIRLVRARRMIYNRLTGKPTNKIPRT